MQSCPKLSQCVEHNIWYIDGLVHDSSISIAWKYCSFYNPDDLLQENIGISNNIFMEHVPWGFANKATSVQIMIWFRTGDKPLSEPMVAEYLGAYMYMHHPAPMC